MAPFPGLIMRRRSPRFVTLITAAAAVLGAPGISEAAQTQSLFTLQEQYREVLRLQKVAGDTERARALATDLLGRVPRENPLYDDVAKTASELSQRDLDSRFKLALQYATGTKTEVYCKDVGLVHLVGKHNDGSQSKVVLVQNSRKTKPGSYSVLASGAWKYELSSTFRAPQVSELWLEDGDDASFDIKEVRRLEDGKVDEGTSKCRFDGDRQRCSVHTKGEVEEPYYIFMALDFHLWGQRDLGYPIDFRPGAKDERIVWERFGRRGFSLKSKRTVTRALPDFSYVDSRRASHAHQDCFEVVTDIFLGEIKDK